MFNEVFCLFIYAIKIIRASKCNSLISGELDFNFRIANLLKSYFKIRFRMMFLTMVLEDYLISKISVNSRWYAIAAGTTKGHIEIVKVKNLNWKSLEGILYRKAVNVILKCEKK